MNDDRLTEDDWNERATWVRDSSGVPEPRAPRAGRNTSEADPTGAASGRFVGRSAVRPVPRHLDDDPGPVMVPPPDELAARRQRRQGRAQIGDADTPPRLEQRPDARAGRYPAERGRIPLPRDEDDGRPGREPGGRRRAAEPDNGAWQEPPQGRRRAAEPDTGSARTAEGRRRSAEPDDDWPDLDRPLRRGEPGRPRRDGPGWTQERPARRRAPEPDDDRWTDDRPPRRRPAEPDGRRRAIEPDSRRPAEPDTWSGHDRTTTPDAPRRRRAPEPDDDRWTDDRPPRRRPPEPDGRRRLTEPDSRRPAEPDTWSGRERTTTPDAPRRRRAPEPDDDRWTDDRPPRRRPPEPDGRRRPTEPDSRRPAEPDDRRRPTEPVPRTTGGVPPGESPRPVPPPRGTPRAARERPGETGAPRVVRAQPAPPAPKVVAKDGPATPRVVAREEKPVLPRVVSTTGPPAVRAVATGSPPVVPRALPTNTPAAMPKIVAKDTSQVTKTPGTPLPRSVSGTLARPGTMARPLARPGPDESTSAGNTAGPDGAVAATKPSSVPTPVAYPPAAFAPDTTGPGTAAQVAGNATPVGTTAIPNTPPAGPNAAATDVVDDPPAGAVVEQPVSEHPVAQPEPEPEPAPDPAAEIGAELGAFRWRLDLDTLREVVHDEDALRALDARIDEALNAAANNGARARLLSLRTEVLRLVGEMDRAASTGKLALAHAQAAGDPSAIALAQAELAYVLRLRGEFVEADRLFALSASADIPDPLRAAVYENAGRCSFDQHRYLEACNFFGWAIRLGDPEDLDLIARVEVAVDAVYIGIIHHGWGPLPRTRVEILGAPAQ